MMQRSLVVALLLAGTAGTCRAQQAEPPHDRVALLADANYRTRETTMRAMANDGADAILELALAVNSPNPEIRWRSAKLLEEIGVNGDEQTLTKVTRVLRLLGEQGKRHLSAKSKRLAERWLEAQSARIIAQLQQYGAKVTTYGDADPFGFTSEVLPEVEPEPNVDVGSDAADTQPLALNADDLRKAVEDILADSVQADQQALAEQTAAAAPGRDAQQVPSDVDAERFVVAVGANGRVFVQPNGEVLGLNGSGPMTRSIALDADWSGGANEFELLTRINNLRMLTLHALKLTPRMLEQIGRLPDLQYLLVEKCQYDPDAMLTFRKARDSEQNPASLLTVKITGAGFLGVMGPLDRSDDCLISQVVEDSGAAKAGIQVGDRILAINGRNLTNFQDLITIVACLPPETAIELDVERGTDRFQAKAVLQPRPPIYE